MKFLAVSVLAVATALACFPVLFATGDNPGVGCTVGVDLTPILATIRTIESRNNYAALAAGSSASGAYQFLDASWANFGGYPRAWQAPPAIQDAKAAAQLHRILDRDGDVAAVPVVWYLGHLPDAGSPEWDQVPAPRAGNALTPRQYQNVWLAEYQRQLETRGSAAAAEGAPVCAPGSGVESLADGYAFPGPPELFALAPVDEPHHDYPAWDWPVPVGTPVYAVRGGRVVDVPDWRHNWWDAGCGQSPAGCDACGVGVTIQDDAGTRWTYCHGSAAHVAVGATVPAGTQILSSGDTGRSTGPHLHLQIRTPDGRLRCPQPLLGSLRDEARGVDPASLPTTSCTY